MECKRRTTFVERSLVDSINRSLRRKDRTDVKQINDSEGPVGTVWLLHAMNWILTDKTPCFLVNFTPYFRFCKDSSVNVTL